MLPNKFGGGGENLFHGEAAADCARSRKIEIDIYCAERGRETELYIPIVRVCRRARVCVKVKHRVFYDINCFYDIARSSRETVAVSANVRWLASYCRRFILLRISL
jgi:hypothetical protein